MALVYLAFTAAFNLLPRSTYSELEKRDLQHFPAFTPDSLLDGSYTAAISSWYSDTEPYRDTLMYMSMQFRDMLGVRHIDYARKQIVIAPPPDLPIDWCEGTIPVSGSEAAYVRWERAQGRICIDVDLPPGWTAE